LYVASISKYKKAKNLKEKRSVVVVVVLSFVCVCLSAYQIIKRKSKGETL